jgi:hypothetical protein
MRVSTSWKATPRPLASAIRASHRSPRPSANAIFAATGKRIRESPIARQSWSREWQVRLSLSGIRSAPLRLPLWRSYETCSCEKTGGHLSVTA